MAHSVSYTPIMEEWKKRVDEFLKQLGDKNIGQANQEHHNYRHGSQHDSQRTILWSHASLGNDSDKKITEEDKRLQRLINLTLSENKDQYLFHLASQGIKLLEKFDVDNLINKEEPSKMEIVKKLMEDIMKQISQLEKEKEQPNTYFLLKSIYVHFHLTKIYTCLIFLKKLNLLSTKSMMVAKALMIILANFSY